MIFEAQVANNLQDHVKYTKYYMTRIKPIPTYTPSVLFTVAGVVLAVLGHLEGLFLVLVASVVPFIILHFAASTARKRADNKTFLGGSATYRFDDTGVMGIVKADEKQTVLKVSYDEMFKVYESKEAFYLFFKQDVARIVPKRSVVRGDVLQLSDLLKAKLGSRKKG